MPPVVRSVAAPSGAVADHGRRSSSAMWTGDKRRRTIGGPSPRPLGLGSSSDDTLDAMLMDDDSDTRPQVQDEQGGQEREEGFVFSAEDDIDEQELSRCCQELLLRERPIYVQIAPSLKGKARKEVYERLCGLRFKEYKASLISSHHIIYLLSIHLMIIYTPLNIYTTISIPLVYNQ